jgi:hypothetical protein
MVRIIVILLIVAAALPLLVERTPSPCDALERRLVNMASRGADDPALANLLGGLAQQLTGGGLAEAAAKEEYPNLPAPLACYIIYYRAYYQSIVKA